MRANTVAGFTLIELIGTLVILGLVGMAGSMGFANIVEGYLFAADNVNLAQKAQTTLDRIGLELMNINFPTSPGAGRGVVSSSRTSIEYDADFGVNRGEETGNRISLDAGANRILLRSNGVERVLADSVTGLSLDYFDTYSEVSPSARNSYLAYSPSSPYTRIIGVTVTMTGANNVAQTFSIRVMPKFLRETS